MKYEWKELKNYFIINLIELAHSLLIKGAATIIYGLMTMVSDTNFISMVKAAIRIQSSWSIFKWVLDLNNFFCK